MCLLLLVGLPRSYSAAPDAPQSWTDLLCLRAIALAILHAPELSIMCSCCWLLHVLILTHGIVDMTRNGLYHAIPAGKYARVATHLTSIPPSHTPANTLARMSI